MKSRRGNQSLVTPVPKKAGGSRHPRTSSASLPHGRPRHITSATPLIPEGWAPGPAGEGTPSALPSLVISLPEALTEPHAIQNYEAMREQLRREIRAGRHDALKVIINARLQTLAHTKARPHIVLVSLYCIVTVSR